MPIFFTIAFSVIALDSTGFVGDQDMPVITKSGFGAGVPYTSNSAICPAGAPELAVILSCRRLTVAVTGMVTVFPEAGLNEYDCADTRFPNVVVF
ncbi:hypothetical protein D3C75_466040 [compost metagenome]